MRIFVTVCLVALLVAGVVIADEGPFAGPDESLLLKRLAVATTETEGRLAAVSYTHLTLPTKA